MPYMRLTLCFSRRCRPKSDVRWPEVRPCWPGLESNFALSLIERRALFRNRSVPSRRESLALGPRERATFFFFSVYCPGLLAGGAAMRMHIGGGGLGC